MSGWLRRRVEVQRTKYRRERGDAVGGAYVIEVERGAEWWLLCELCSHRERLHDLDAAVAACDRHALGHLAKGQE